MNSSPMWTAPTIERRENLPSASERESLENFLDWQRETLLWKCGGLTGEQLISRPLPTTGLSLLGLVRHLALNERWWFRMRFLGDEALEEIFSTEEDPDWEFNGGTADSAESDYAVFLEEIESARQAVAGHDLDEKFEGRKHTMTLRWVYLHMIEEYARHIGHADLLREAIDGVTGE